jgi:hypothetical protein
MIEPSRGKICTSTKYWLLLLFSFPNLPVWTSQKSVRSRKIRGPRLANMKSKNHQAFPTSIAGLTPLELARKILLADAAAHNSVHVDTFKKNYSHLLKRIGKRRCATGFNCIIQRWR